MKAILVMVVKARNLPPSVVCLDWPPGTLQYDRDQHVKDYVSCVVFFFTR